MTSRPLRLSFFPPFFRPATGAASPATGLLLACACALLLARPLPAAPGELLWSLPLADSLYSSAAIDWNRRVLYLGAEIEPDDGAIIAVSFAQPTPKVLWSFPTGDWVDSSPAIGPDGTVYAASWDGKLYALNPETGAQKWAFATSNLVQASPAIGPDGTIYFGSTDGFFYALHPNGSLRWERFIGSEIESSAAIDLDGTIYFGTYDGILYALRPLTGLTKWTYQVENQTGLDRRIVSSPAISPGGLITFGSGNSWFYALNADGSLAWKARFAEEMDSSPVIDSGNNLYFGSRAGFLYKLDSGGLEVWQKNLGDIYYSSPVLDAAGNVYVVAYAGNGQSRLYAFDSAGSNLWSADLPAVVDASPVITPDGLLIVGAYDGKLYAFDTGIPPGDVAWPRFGHSLSGRRSLQDFPALQGFPSRFPLADSLDSSWSYESWLGPLYLPSYPWLYLPSAGWFYAAGPGLTSHWFYFPALGWTWTGPDTFPYLWRHSSSSWLYLDLSSGSPYIYDFADPGWDPL